MDEQLKHGDVQLCWVMSLDARLIDVDPHAPIIYSEIKIFERGYMVNGDDLPFLEKLVYGISAILGLDWC